ncbi:hypothetical protein [Desulfolucanica intricata]|uniref:hypothetical protein n=1 Tax=Desulfolucanica intricata TaxID=1285191 RepID=UPI00082F3E01|nr:hypothetical protein [Desulfolucanica intricata]
MFTKRLSTILVVMLLILGAVSTAWAGDIGVTFQNNGVEYIFSANPENINGTTGNHYTIEKDLYTGYTYDIELYHHNYTGETKRFGVALYNPNSSTATITVNAKVINDCAATGESTELDMTAPLVEQYVLGYGSTSISIPAKSYTFLMYKDVPTQRTVSGKAKVSTNLSGVKARVFHGPQYVSASTVFSYTRDTDYESNITTGFFNYDGKYNSSTIDASTYPTFKLSEWRPSLNVNEYETGSNVLGSSILGGNYGMTYTITVKNAANKRLKIIPNFKNLDCPAAALVLYSPQIGWFRTGKLINDKDSDYYDQYWLMSMGTSSTFTFKYILPASNFGNVSFQVID